MAQPIHFQDTLPDMTCFGCGPANPHGLQLKSTWSADRQFVVATHHPQAQFNAGISNVMHGGTVASLIDCHSVWAAIAFTHRAEGREVGSQAPIIYVTAKLAVEYLKPTPLDQPVHLKAWVEGEIGHMTRVLCELGPDGQITALGEVIAARVTADKLI